jgi:hypothetical protein
LAAAAALVVMGAAMLASSNVFFLQVALQIVAQNTYG